MPLLRPFVWITKEQVLYTGRSPVYSEDEFDTNSPVISSRHGIGTGPNPFEAMPILTNPVPIPGQSEQVQCQSWPIQCQFHAITEAICLDNQGTSALYGTVSSLLGGRSSRHPGT